MLPAGRSFLLHLEQRSGFGIGGPDDPRKQRFNEMVTRLYLPADEVLLNDGTFAFQESPVPFLGLSRPAR